MPTVMPAYSLWPYAEGGHLDILRLAREHGCPMNDETCKWAAIGGHVEVLQWARAQGCQW
jgi:hypothetical protein